MAPQTVFRSDPMTVPGVRAALRWRPRSDRGSSSGSGRGKPGGAARPTRVPDHPWPAWLRKESPRIEEALRGVLRKAEGIPPSLLTAMRYSLFPGGKRIRPALCVLGYRFCGGRGREIYRLGACLEMIHTFTLIHDDLPCMDDDDFRRGRPSCHNAFGEGLAVLAGDALLNLAYETVASLRCAPDRKVAILAVVSGAVGGRGVLGGQVDDLAAEGKRVGERTLRSIHARKTAVLMAASLRAGGQMAGGCGQDLRRLDRYGMEMGLLFQIVDDLLNLEGTEAELGRPAGGDERHHKATYPRVVGRAGARRLLAVRVGAARRTARDLGRRAALFDDLVRAVASRVKGGWPEETP